jgi:AraC family transcriptional regulator
MTGADRANKLTAWSFYVCGCSMKKHLASIDDPALRVRSTEMDIAAPSEGERQHFSLVSEFAWRVPVREASAASSSRPAVVATRWTRTKPGTQALIHHTANDRHIVAIALMPTDIEFFAGTRLMHDGRLAAGAIQVSGANSKSTALFRAPCDVLHLHVPDSLIAQQYEEALGDSLNAERLFSDAHFFFDPEIERLSLAILTATDLESAAGDRYVESLSSAIVAKILGREIDAQLEARTGRTKNRLVGWRLRRAVAYIEANLSLPIRLDDISSSAGLTKMHFAAQFRESTGYSPHAYVIYRRIRRAETLLRQKQYNILEVAQSCGFASHAHFCAVFKKTTGYSPSQWRVRFAATSAPTENGR